MPCSFTQLFKNEGKEILPMLWELKKDTEKSKEFFNFTDKLANAIYRKYNLFPGEDKAPRLPPQQLAMLPYLSKGLTYSEIAKQTGIERSTVKYHILQMYKRLNVNSAKEAIVKAKILGLLE
jgi:LuxR family maltose regulon positive regulatory protein